MSSGSKVFGKRIKELRERKKLTQEKLAEKIGLDLQTISRIETGYYFTSFENLEKLANALDVTIADLFDFEHVKTKEELIKEMMLDDDVEDILDLSPEYAFTLTDGSEYVFSSKE